MLRYSLYNNLFILGGGGGEDEGASGGKTKTGGTAVKVCRKCWSHSQEGGGGGTWVFFRWVCAAWDSKLAPHSKKTFP